MKKSYNNMFGLIHIYIGFMFIIENITVKRKQLSNWST